MVFVESTTFVAFPQGILNRRGPQGDLKVLQELMRDIDHG
jgi:hypothetical protein